MNDWTSTGVAVCAALATGGAWGCQTGGAVGMDATGGRSDTAQGLDVTAVRDADTARADATSRSDTAWRDTLAADAPVETGVTETGVRRRTLGLYEPPAYLKKCEPAEPSAEAAQWLQANPPCFGEGPALFEDATLRAGLGHPHTLPPSAEKNEGYGVEHGGGAVLEDLTGDGWLDLYVTGGHGSNKLYYNQGDGTFVDCTDYAGVGFAEDWSNGVSAADFDNDGDQDIYVANTGADRLLRNNGDGTFRDVTDQVGIVQKGRSSTASWGDVDGDGYLDIYVASLSEEGAMEKSKVPAEGAPIESTPASFFFGQAGTSFAEPTLRFPQSGLRHASSFLASLVDLDDDRDLDVLLPLENGDSALLRNDGLSEPDERVKWSDVGKRANIEALNAPMGVDFLDVNADGRLDIFASTLWGMPPSREDLLVNRGGMRFRNEAGKRGAHAMIQARQAPVARAASWAALAFDVESDGDDDLYLTYGNEERDVFENGSPVQHKRQPNALLLNDGRGQFREATGSCTEDRGRSRGAVYGDVNADGCMDIFVVNHRTASRLLLNRCRDSGHYLELRLRATSGARDAIGARVEVTAGGETQVKQVLAGSRGEYSSMPKRLHFGLGDATEAERIEITWPSGKEQTLTDILAGQLLRIQEPQ